MYMPGNFYKILTSHTPTKNKNKIIYLCKNDQRHNLSMTLYPLVKLDFNSIFILYVIFLKFDAKRKLIFKVL